MVEMELGCMLLMAIGDGACLAVLAAPRCDMGLVAYEMTLLVDRAGELVTPQLRSRLGAAAD
jgi:predicted regulator of Ras-like GTPase activity (Roadblock/LC7/MglB family)